MTDVTHGSLPQMCWRKYNDRKVKHGGETMTPELAEVGQFCPNKECERHGDIKNAQIIQYGKTAKGTQRYLCKVCESTFVETTGTVFYGKHTPRKDILETLAMLAEGMRISSVSRVKGFKEDTGLAARSSPASRTGRSHADEGLSGQSGAD